MNNEVKDESDKYQEENNSENQNLRNNINYETVQNENYNNNNSNNHQENHIRESVFTMSEINPVFTQKQENKIITLISLMVALLYLLIFHNLFNKNIPKTKLSDDGCNLLKDSSEKIVSFFFYLEIILCIRIPLFFIQIVYKHFNNSEVDLIKVILSICMLFYFIFSLILYFYYGIFSSYNYWYADIPKECIDLKNIVSIWNSINYLILIISLIFCCCGFCIFTISSGVEPNYMR